HVRLAPHPVDRARPPGVLARLIAVALRRLARAVARGLPSGLAVAARCLATTRRLRPTLRVLVARRRGVVGGAARHAAEHRSARPPRPAEAPTARITVPTPRITASTPPGRPDHRVQPRPRP